MGPNEESKIKPEDIDDIISPDEEIEETHQMDEVVSDADVYALPEDKEVIVDPEKDEVKNLEDLTPWEKIMTAAEKHGVEIHNPKSNCRRCYGRGYTGVELKTQMPVACICIFPKDKRNNNTLGQTMNFKMRRRNKLFQKTKRYKKQMRLINELEEQKLKKQLYKAGEQLALKKKRN